jgi:hypothetical protein
VDTSGVWILPLQRVRHKDPTEALRQIVLVPLAHVFQVCRQQFLHSRWQHRFPILIPLAFTEYNLVAGEVNVLHSESQALQEAQAGTI